MHLAGWNVVTATPAQLGARQKRTRLFCACGSHREFLDYPVNLILGLLRLDQKLCNHVRPLLS